MTTELAMTQDFQTRIFEKIRASIGDLMTDDDLKRLVEAAMRKAFFEPVIERRQYGPDIHHPSEIVLLIKGLMDERVSKAVGQWLTDHPEEVAKAINETIGKGITGIIQSYTDQRAQQPMYELGQRLQQAGVLR